MCLGHHAGTAKRADAFDGVGDGLDPGVDDFGDGVLEFVDVGLEAAVGLSGGDSRDFDEASDSAFESSSWPVVISRCRWRGSSSLRLAVPSCDFRSSDLA